MRLSLIKWPGSGGGGSGTVNAANNGVSLLGMTTVQLGQDVGEVGSPATLTSIREIPLDGFSVSFLTSTGKNLYVGEEGYAASPSWHSSSYFNFFSDLNTYIWNTVGTDFDDFPLLQLATVNGLTPARYAGVVGAYMGFGTRGDLLMTTFSNAGPGQGQGGDIYLRPSTNISGLGDPTFVTQYEDGSIFLQPSYSGIVSVENGYDVTILKVGSGTTGTDTLQVFGTAITTQYNLSALNTAPSSSSDTGTLGEIRVTATFIYVCTAANTWVRAALTTF